MAEEKDYLSGLLQDVSIGDQAIRLSPPQYLELIKQKLIAMGAKPGTNEYGNAFRSYLGIRSGHQGTFGGGGFTFSTAADDALNYIDTKLNMNEIQGLGVDPFSWDLGKDRKGAWRSKSGEIIPNNDQYQRGREGEREVDPNTGLPLYSAYAPFATITTGQQGGMLKLEDLDVVPESAFWYLKPEFNRRLDAKGNVESYQRDIADELLAIGFVPGAKVTPELAAKYRQYQLSRMSPQLYSQVTGQPYAPGYDLQGNYKVTPSAPSPSDISALPSSISPSTQTAAKPAIKTAPIDTVQFDDDLIPDSVLKDLLFQNIGGQELINTARTDTVNGQQVIYNIIKNLSSIQQQYNPNNIVSLQDTSDKYFDNFTINFDFRVPDKAFGQEYIYINSDNGELVIEAVNLRPDEQIEVQIRVSGTIYEAEL
jgi:Fe2+ transport system protein FeoA